MVGRGDRVALGAPAGGAGSAVPGGRRPGWAGGNPPRLGPSCGRGGGGPGVWGRVGTIGFGRDRGRWSPVIQGRGWQGGRGGRVGHSLCSHRGNRDRGERLALVDGLSALGRGFGDGAGDISGGRTAAGGGEGLPWAAPAPAAALGMPGVVHPVLDQADRSDPADRGPTV